MTGRLEPMNKQKIGDYKESSGSVPIGGTILPFV